MFHDRIHAAHLLAERLIEYKNREKEVVVVAIPRGGALVGYHLANALGLPLDVIPSKRIKDPSNPTQSLGSVSLEGVDIPPNELEIPQDYICHQIQMIQQTLKHVHEKYVGSQSLKILTNKTLLLVDDRINSASQILASYRSLEKHRPNKIIVVVPILTDESLQRLNEENCEVIYLESTCHTDLSGFYNYLPKLSDNEIVLLFHDSGLKIRNSCLT
jgi:putative phosphoribosyl transferase